MHARVRLRHADDRLNVTDGDRNGARGERLTAQLGKEVGQFGLVNVLQLGMDLFACVHNVLAKEVLPDRTLFGLDGIAGIVRGLVVLGVALHVAVDHKRAQLFVLLRIHNVFDDT